MHNLISFCFYIANFSQDIFHPKSSRAASIDGAYFGTTMPHLFLLNRPALIPAAASANYVPRIYGFRINKESVYHRGTRDRSDRRDARESEKSGRRGGGSSKGSKKSTGGGGVSPQGPREAFAVRID
jgi:casein kinase II subunit beta